jgi:ribosome recycling factor
MEPIIKDSEKNMREALSHLGEELKKIRTGRASTSLVEDIKVSYYGSFMLMKEVATLSAPEPGLIQIKPFDRNSISDIELAIRNSDLGLSPINDGNFVRLNLPPLTEERRVEFVRQAKKIGESAKIALRTVRGESWDKIQKMVKDGSLTEDDKYGGEKKLNELIDKMNGEVDRIVTEKEKEIMSL